MKIAVSLDVTPCSLVVRYQRLEQRAISILIRALILHGVRPKRKDKQLQNKTLPVQHYPVTNSVSIKTTVLSFKFLKGIDIRTSSLNTHD
jgi:hypothetical protein